jgi:type II secretory pathway pseudopilin PulG
VFDFLMKRNKRQSGATLVETLIAAGLIGIASSVLVSAISTAMDMKMKRQSSQVVSTFREKLIGSINSTNGWVETVSKNGITCLQAAPGVLNPPGCTGGNGWRRIRIFDGSPTQLTGWDDDNLGFDHQFKPCIFTDVNWCPFRFVVQWRPICESPASCVAPLIDIRGFLYVNERFKDHLTGGPGRFNFDFVRGVATSNAKRECLSLGGTFNDATSSCVLPTPVGTCPAGQIVVGIINGSGQIECAPLTLNSCPSGSYVKGVDKSGNLICRCFTAATCPEAPPGGPNKLAAIPGGDGTTAGSCAAMGGGGGGGDPGDGGGGGGGFGDSGGGDCGDGGGDCG